MKGHDDDSSWPVNVCNANRRIGESFDMHELWLRLTDIDRHLVVSVARRVCQTETQVHVLGVRPENPLGCD